MVLEPLIQACYSHYKIEHDDLRQIIEAIVRATRQA